MYFFSKVKKKKSMTKFLFTFISLKQAPKSLHPTHTPHTDKTCEPPDCFFFFFLKGNNYRNFWCKLLAITVASGTKTEGDTRVAYLDEGWLSFFQFLSKGL